MLNAGGGFRLSQQVGLVNKGTGSTKDRAHPREIFQQGYYVLATASIFDSKYRGSDGILRNTSFNYKYVFNFLAEENGR